MPDDAVDIDALIRQLEAVETLHGIFRRLGYELDEHPRGNGLNDD